jgi:ribosomal protein S18 acetylase RimI-like enzyme
MGDRGDVLRISADTAVFGDPVEAILEDRQVFCDAFTAYYTDYESEYAWVACLEEKVVGYLTGCINTMKQRRRWLKYVLPSVLLNLMRGRYTIGKKTWRYVYAMMGSALRREYPAVDHHEFPAHLHINIEASARGKGLGRRLLKVYLVQLNQLDVPGVFLETTNINEAACRLYEGSGFEILVQRETKVWQDVMQRPVVNLIYGMRMVNK